MKITRGVAIIASQIADLISDNIKAGITIFGITGKTEVVDTTTAVGISAGAMQTGKEAFVNGSKVTGSGTKTLSVANDTVAAGYYAATTLSTVDTDLATANIKAGVTIFGVDGKTEVVDTTEAPGYAATAATILMGKKAWVNGVEITGIFV